VDGGWTYQQSRARRRQERWVVTRVDLPRTAIAEPKSGTDQAGGVATVRHRAEIPSGWVVTIALTIGPDLRM
jgi:hypothetical protein